MKLKVLNYLTSLFLTGYGVYQIGKYGFTSVPIIITVVGVISLGLGIYMENLKSKE